MLKKKKTENVPSNEKAEETFDELFDQLKKAVGESETEKPEVKKSDHMNDGENKELKKKRSLNEESEESMKDEEKEEEEDDGIPGKTVKKSESESFDISGVLNIFSDKADQLEQTNKKLMKSQIEQTKIIEGLIKSVTKTAETVEKLTSANKMLMKSALSVPVDSGSKTHADGKNEVEDLKQIDKSDMFELLTTALKKGAIDLRESEILRVRTKLGNLDPKKKEEQKLFNFFNNRSV